MNLLKIFASLAASAITLVPANAIAQSSAHFNGPHKWTDASSGKTYVYVINPDGVTGSGQPIPGFSSPKAPKSRVLTLNNCGWGSFTKSVTSPPTNITGANWAGKTSGAAPTCTKAVAPATGYVDSNSSAATGTIIDDGTKLHIKGGTAAGSLTIEVQTTGNITTKTNACGFVRVATSTSRPMSTFTFDGATFQLSTLPSVTNPLKCAKVGNTSVLYVPNI